MQRIGALITRVAEPILAAMLAAMFATFLIQIFSRYVMLQPFGWTLELCLILWIWVVFLGCAFIVRPRDHVVFDIIYLSAPMRIRRILALISAAAIAIGMIYAIVPTWDYVDFMRMRRTATVENPFTGAKIPLRTIFFVYMIFLVAVSVRAVVSLWTIWRHGPPETEMSVAKAEASE